MKELLLPTVFIFYTYAAFSIFILGFIYKLFTINKKNIENDKSLSKTINIGLLTIVFIHFAGYFIAREIFIFIGISGKVQESMAHISSGIITTIILTYIVVVICTRYLKQKLSFGGSKSEKFMYVIIVAHILLGFFAIALIGDGDMKVSKYSSIKHYLKDLTRFNLDAYKHLDQMNWITLTHMTLGLTLLLVFPFTRIIDQVVYGFQKKL